MINWQSIKHTTFCQNTTYIIWLIAKYQSFPTSNSEKIIIYWILAESIAAYLLITWANRWADPSLNLTYTVL